MANLTVTVDATLLPEIDALWQSRGYADFAARLQEFVDEEARAAKIQVQQKIIASETVKGGSANPITIKDALYAEYLIRTSKS